MRRRDLKRNPLWVAALASIAVHSGVGCSEKDAGDDTRRTPEAPAAVAAGVTSVLPEVPGFSAPEFEHRLRPIMERVATGKDTWDSEAFNDAVSRQFQLLTEWVESGAADSEPLRSIATDTFATAGLRPEPLTPVWEGSVRVLRTSPGATPPDAAEPRHRGPDGLADALHEMLRPFEDAAAHLKFKVFHVGEADPEGAVLTRAYASVFGKPGFQQNAVWETRWTPAPDSGDPLIASIRVEDFEEVQPGEESSLAFEDATLEVLGGADSFRRQLSKGAGYWSNRLERRYDIDSTGHQGIAIADVNGDGLEDLHVCQQGGLPNLLYLRNPDGTLRDVSAEAGVDWMENSHAALFVDLDNDGDPDLALARAGYLLVMENDGTGRFEVKFRFRNESIYYSIASIDYDNDRLPDLYFCGNTPLRQPGEGEGARGGPITTRTTAAPT